MTKEEILDYVMNTPDNTNRAVLSDMLDEFSSGSGGGNPTLVVEVTSKNNVWTCEKTWQEIFDAFLTSAVVLRLPDDGQANFILISNIFYSEAIYYIAGGDGFSFSTDNANGYPSMNYL